MFARESLPTETVEMLAGIADVIAHGVERRHAEDALRAAQENLRQHADELEKTVAERTQSLRDTISSLERFSYTIAHDLRAPVRSIYSFGSLLMEEHAAQLDPAAQDYIQRITAGAKRMDTLIQDLLAYNRLEHEQVPVTRVALDAIFSAAIEERSGRVRESGARLSVEPLPAVFGNATLLQQVAGNLIDNALKFVPPGTTPNVEVSATERDGEVRVTVKDNGIGIDPAHHRRIFGVFERLHGQQTYPGTGIGLAIAAKALERMGGSVGLESEPGRGSAFWFELPRAQ
jgi:signal transduction histidine kinase